MSRDLAADIKGGNMRKLSLLAAAAFAATAVPASATTVIYGGNTYNSGDSINISFTGVQYPGSSGDLTLTFTGTRGNDFDFTYSLLNTSSDPSTNIRALGFDITGGTIDFPTSRSTRPYTGL